MTVLLPVSRLTARVQEPPPLDFAPPPYGDMGLEHSAFGLELWEGPYPSPLGLEHSAFGIEFDVSPAQEPWGLEHSAFGLEFGAGQEPWGLEHSAFGITIGAGLGTPADTIVWGLEHSRFGLYIDPPWGLEHSAFGLQIQPAALPTRTVTYCWNLRLDPPQCTTWANWPLAHITRVNGKNYAYHDGKLYLLGGATDDGQPINSSVTLTPFAGVKDADGRTFRSRCPWIHAGANTTGNIYALVDVDGSETYQEWGPYPINLGGGNLRRAQPGKGLSSGFWGFRIENKDGERLKLSTLTFDFQATSRRI